MSTQDTKHVASIRRSGESARSSHPDQGGKRKDGARGYLPGLGQLELIELNLASDIGDTGHRGSAKKKRVRLPRHAFATIGLG
jgi:hypothetical protein